MYKTPFCKFGHKFSFSYLWLAACYFISQAIIITAFLTLGLFAGGVASAVNVADIQDDYLDQINCKEYDPSNDFIRQLCNDLEEVRSSQVSAAVSPS